jgi:hypothetical protein
MAGILPFSYNPTDNKLYYLLSRESHTHPKAAKQFSDFGGSKERNESKISTAAREGYEETQGMLGSEKTINNHISKLPQSMILKTKYNTYTTFLYQIKHNEDIALIMNRLYHFMKKNVKVIVDEPNGYFEKDHHILVTLEQLKSNFYTKLRPFYRQIVDQIDEIKILKYIQITNK